MEPPSSGEFLLIDGPLTEEKLKKILEDYVKIKKQNAVLKKAVLQEQQKTSVLEAQLKEKDQQLRKSVEDNDILTFNNESLTKRFNALRQELEKRDSKTDSPGWFAGNLKSEIAKKKQEMAVLAEELSIKIKENEQLHMKMFEMKQENTHTMETLEQKINALKKQVQKGQEDMDKREAEQRELLAQINEAKHAAESSAQSLAAELEKTTTLHRDREQMLKQEYQQLVSQLTQCQELIHRKIKFDDIRFPEFNKLNAPTFDSKAHQRMTESGAKVLALLRAFCGGYSEYHSALSKRLALQPTNPQSEPLKNIIKKIITLLPSHNKLLEELHNSYARIFTHHQARAPVPVDYQKAAAKAIDDYVSFAKKLHSYQLMRLEEENKQIDCPEPVRVINSDLTAVHNTIQATLEKLMLYINLILNVAPPNGTELNVSLSNTSFILKQIHQTIIAFSASLKEFNRESANKIAEEHKDAMWMAMVKPLHTNLVNSLQAATNTLDALSGAVEELVRLQTTPVLLPVRGAEVTYENGVAEVTELQSKARKYATVLASIQLPEKMSYWEAVKQSKQLQEAQAALQQLQTQKAAATEQLAALNKEKERIQQELSSLKDSNASKQSQLNARLTELASTREKLDQVSSLYNEALAQNTQLQEQLKKAQQQQLTMAVLPPTSSSSLPPVLVPRPASVQLPAPPAQPGGDLLISFEDWAVPPSSAPSAISSSPLSSTPATAPATVMNGVNASPSSPSTPLIDFPELPRQVSAPVSVGTLVDPFDFGDVAVPATINTSVPAPTTPATVAVSTPPASSTPPTPPSSLPPLAEVLQKKEEAVKTSQKKYKLTVLDEHGNQANSLEVSDQDRERERDLRKHYETKINQLLSQVRLADNKAVDVTEEYQKSLAQLEALTSEKNELTKQIEALNNTIKNVREDMETTKKGYETQHNLLSEHLVSLTEKISAQELELSTLKNHKVLCGKCKTWNSVGWLLTEGKNGQRCSKGNHSSGYNFA